MIQCVCVRTVYCSNACKYITVMNIRLYLFGVCARVCVFVRASVKNRVNLHSIASSGLGEGYRLSGQNNDVSLRMCINVWFCNKYKYKHECEYKCIQTQR